MIEPVWDRGKLIRLVWTPASRVSQHQVDRKFVVKSANRWLKEQKLPLSVKDANLIWFCGKYVIDFSETAQVEAEMVEVLIVEKATCVTLTQEQYSQLKRGNDCGLPKGRAIPRIAENCRYHAVVVR